MPLFYCRKCLTFVMLYVIIFTEQKKTNREGENVMRRKQNGRSVSIIFDSINDVINYIRKTERTKFYQSYHVSDDDNREDFTKTKSWNEAENLLLHGWDEGARRLNKNIKSVKIADGYRMKTVYDVSGFQCSVPRYLQGVPTNMINSKRVVQKNKVVNITKDFGYSGAVSAEQMLQEGKKVLDAVNKIESTGTRCNLYVSFVSDSSSGYVDMRIKIKDSSQRLNVKQTAFPLAHPSMFRRITFALIERLEECKDFGYGYGRCTEWREVKHLYKGEYYIPRIVSEQEITDIEKYRVE